MPDPAGEQPDPLDAARQAELLDLAHDAILVRDPRTSAIRYWNRGAERLYGWPRDEALGQITHDLLQTRFPTSLAAVNAALAEVGYWEGELIHCRRDGTTVIVASRQAVQRDPTGQPVAILEINTDTTQQKAAEEERVRRLSEQRARELVERALEQLSRLQSVRIALSSALTPAQVASVVMQHGIRGLGARAGAILRINANSNLVDVLASTGYSEGAVERFRHFSREARVPANTALRSGEAQFVSDFEDWRRDYPDLPEPEKRGAAAAVPFVVDGRVTGALTLSFDGPRAFEPDEQQLLIALAIQCAQALERARLYELAVSTQEDLRRSRDQLAAILAGIAEGVTVQNTDGRLIFANGVAAHMLGYANAEAFLAAPIDEVTRRFIMYDEAGQPLAYDRLPGRRLLLGEAAEELVVQYRDQNTAERRWTILDAAPVNDASGRLQLVVNIFRDITERKRQADATEFVAAASSALSASLDAESALTELAALAVSKLADWCIVDLVERDGSVRRLAVAHADPARVEEARVLRRQDPADIVAGAVGHVLRTGKSELVEDMSPTRRAELAEHAERMRVIDAIDARSWITAPMRMRGSTLGVITVANAGAGRGFTITEQAVLEDVAARAGLAIENGRLFHEAQEQADHQSMLNSALRSTIDERDHALSELHQALRTRDEFLASVSHDLKNPLASIKATAQLLHRRIERGEPDLTRLREGLKRVDDIATRAAGQVEELLDLARMQMGRPLDLDRQPTDLVGLVRQVLAEQQPMTDRHTLVLESDEPRLIGDWDARRLTRVVANLVDNAVKYSPAGGGIVLRIERARTERVGSAVLEVHDSGLGIPAADLGRIFERFQRASNVEGRVGGTGIGLASARHFVESHGGTIEAESVENVGTVIRVRLPLSQPEV